MPPVVAGVGLLAAFGGGAGWSDRGCTSGSASSSRSRPPRPCSRRPSSRSRSRCSPSRRACVASTSGSRTRRRPSASRWYVLRRVTLPLMGPQIAAALVLSWARALGEFGATITFAGNLQGRTQTLPLAVFERCRPTGRGVRVSMLDPPRLRGDPRAAGSVPAMTLPVDVTARRGTFGSGRRSTPAGDRRRRCSVRTAPGKSTLVSTMAGLSRPGGLRGAGTGSSSTTGGRCACRPSDGRSASCSRTCCCSRTCRRSRTSRSRSSPRRRRAEAHDRSEHLLRRLEVAQRARAKPRDLSGGEAQRVALARALVAEPACCSWTNPCRRSMWARARLREVLRTSSNASRGSGSSSRTTRSRRRRWPNGS